MRSPHRSARLFGAPVVVCVLLLIAIPAVAEDLEGSHSSEHFTVTWSEQPSDPSVPDLTDADGDGVPDSIEMLLEAFEEARAFQIETLGLAPPPNDDDYPLYVAPGAETRALPGSTSSRASYILVTPDLVQGASVADVRTFAAHEYAHAIQYGYDYAEDDWIKEATATWTEAAFDVVGHPEVDELAHFLPYPRAGLTSDTNAHEYGAFLFIEFLVERFDDPDVVRKLWESMAASGVGSIAATDGYLRSKGSSLTDAWRDFTLWNWRLERYDEGATYRRALAGSWPRVLRTTEVTRRESCRLTTDGGSPALLPPLSADYVRLRFGNRMSRPGTLKVVGPSGTTAVALLTSRLGKVEMPLTFGSDGMATLGSEFGADATSKVLLALGNSSTGSSSTIGYSVVLEGAHATFASEPGGQSSTTYRDALTLSGTVTCGGAPASATKLTLVQIEDGTGVRSELSLVTDAGGSWSALIDPEARTTYRVELSDPLVSPHTSDEHTVAVRLGVYVDVLPNPVALGSPVTIDGAVFPAHSSAIVLFEYRRPAGRWQAGSTVTTDVTGAFTGELLLPRKGVWEVRAQVTNTGDSDHEPGVSAAHTVVVDPTP